MLSSFLSSTPKAVEELHFWDWIIIIAVFILYCLVLTLTKYFLLNMINIRTMIGGVIYLMQV